MESELLKHIDSWLILKILDEHPCTSLLEVLPPGLQVPIYKLKGRVGLGQGNVV